MRLLILLFPVCLVFGIHSTPKDPVSIVEQSIDSLSKIDISPNANSGYGGTLTETQWQGSEAIAQATTVPSPKQ